MVVPYDARWPTEFRLTADELRRLLGSSATRIDHVGSTSVPGLAAKDVIDVQVSVKTFDLEFLVDRMESGGYEHPPTGDRDRLHRDHVPPWVAADDEGWRKVFFAKRSSTGSVNAHVRIDGAANARYALLFRDYLRRHPRAAAAYAELKRKLAALDPPIEMFTYADLKDPACDIVMAAAEDWAERGGWKLGPSDA